MEHDLRVRQAAAHPGLAGREEEGPHRRRLAQAQRADGRADVLHRVVDGEACCDAPTWRVDVERDSSFGIFGFEEQ